jgi:hypothetical protein
MNIESFVIPILDENHSKEVQLDLFSRGCCWWSCGKKVNCTKAKFLHVNEKKITYLDSLDYLVEDDCPPVLVISQADFDLIAPKSHSITIDGKTIELSEESYQNLKSQLCD